MRTTSGIDYDTVLRALPDPLLILDRSGHITIVNEAAEHLLGLQSALLLGRRYDAARLFSERGWALAAVECVHAESHPVEHVLATGESSEGSVFVLDRPNRGRSYLGATAVPLHEGGVMTGIALQYRDVSREISIRHESEWLREDLIASRRRLEELLRLSDALNEINGVVHSTLDYEEVLGVVVVEAAHALDVDAARIVMPKGREWVPHVVFGLSPETIDRPLDSAAAALRSVAESRDPLVVPDLDADPRFAGGDLNAVGIKSLIAAPLLARGRVEGILSFLRKLPGTFTSEQVDFAMKVTTTASLAMENARAYEEEHHIAETLQRALLESPHTSRGVVSAHLYESATEAAWVGGDFFDLFELPGDRVGILIGDVSGKGVEASALAAFTRQLLRAHASESTSPAAAIARTNDLVYRTSRTEDFVTLFFGLLSLEDGRLVYSNAGHPPPVLWRNGHAEILSGRGAIIGAFEGLEWQDEVTTLSGDDLLFLYTDGLVEARRNGEMFGDTRLAAMVEALAPAPLEELAEAIVHAIRTFSGGNLKDDVALLLVSPDGRAEPQ